MLLHQFNCTIIGIRVFGFISLIIKKCKSVANIKISTHATENWWLCILLEILVDFSHVPVPP